MQSSVPVVSVTPVTASPSSAKPLPVLTDFGDELTKLLTAIAPVGTVALAATPAEATATHSTTAPCSSPANATAQQLPACLVATTLAPAGMQTPVPAPMRLMPADAATARSRAAAIRRSTETAHSDMMAGVGAPGQVVPPQVATPAAIPPPSAASPPKSEEDTQPQPAAASRLSTLPEHPPALPSDAPQSAKLVEAAVDHGVRLELVTVPAATMSPEPSPPATTAVSTQASSAPPSAAQIAAALASMRHTPNEAQPQIMKEPEPIQNHIDRATDVAPARVAIMGKRPDTPGRLATILASAGDQTPDLKTPLPATADAMAERQNGQPAPDQPAAVQMPPSPSVIGIPDVEPRTTYPASDAAARSRPAAMHPETGNNATTGTGPTAWIGDEQLVLAPTTVPIPTADPQPAQLATGAPDRAPKRQIPSPAVTPGSSMAKQPLESPPDTSQPGASGEGAAPMRREAAADSDAKPEPVTAPAASAALMPSLAATPFVRTPATPAAMPGTPHASPATQIAPALASLSHAPDGTQWLTMKLEPPELGQVQIRIERPAENAPAHIAITVERPETLQLLLHDQPQLQRALDLAGVPAEGRSISFHVATPEPAVRSDTAVAPAPAGSSSATGGDLSFGASRQGGQPAQRDAQQTTAGIVEDNETVKAMPITPIRWLRAGLDITA